MCSPSSSKQREQPPCKSSVAAAHTSLAEVHTQQVWMRPLRSELALVWPPRWLQVAFALEATIGPIYPQWHATSRPRRRRRRVCRTGQGTPAPGPSFASSPSASGCAGRGHRRGLDGPSMPTPLKRTRRLHPANVVRRPAMRRPGGSGDSSQRSIRRRRPQADGGHEWRRVPRVAGPHQARPAKPANREKAKQPHHTTRITPAGTYAPACSGCPPDPAATPRRRRSVRRGPRSAGSSSPGAARSR